MKKKAKKKVEPPWLSMARVWRQMDQQSRKSFIEGATAMLSLIREAYKKSDDCDQCFRTMNDTLNRIDPEDFTVGEWAVRERINRR